LGHLSYCYAWDESHRFCVYGKHEPAKFGHLSPFKVVFPLQFLNVDQHKIDSIHLPREWIFRCFRIIPVFFCNAFKRIWTEYFICTDTAIFDKIHRIKYSLWDPWNTFRDSVSSLPTAHLTHICPIMMKFLFCSRMSSSIESKISVFQAGTTIKLITDVQTDGQKNGFNRSRKHH
jgi:hypothetical protein